jgi:hypothetical protein
VRRWCASAWCDMVWYGMVWYGMGWCGMGWYRVVWCGMVWDRIGSDRIGLDGLGWVGLGWGGLGCARVGWAADSAVSGAQPMWWGPLVTVWALVRRAPDSRPLSRMRSPLAPLLCLAQLPTQQRSNCKSSSQQVTGGIC